jgi:hypothetical protein
LKMALHYKALCDAGLPGYAQLEAQDYALWRHSQAQGIAALEASADFRHEQTEALEAFRTTRESADPEERALQTKALVQICDVALVNQFKTGAPAYEAASAPVQQVPPEVMQGVLQNSAAQVKSTVTTVHRTAAPPAVSGGMRQPPPN